MPPILARVRGHAVAERRGVSTAERRKLSNFKARIRLSLYRTMFFAAILFSFLGLFLSYHSLVFLESKGASNSLQATSGYHPVLDAADPQRFSNVPVSQFRPRYQFSGSDVAMGMQARAAASGVPVLSVLTVTKNPTNLFTETADFVRRQSLRPISWVIVNDHSDSEESVRLLRRVAESDFRVSLINSSAPGFTHGRMAALKHLLEHPTEYFTFLDDDDMYELTAYEKCVWMLESNDNISMCGSYVVAFGEENYILDRGFHNDQSVHFNENLLTGSEVLRTGILKDTNCTYDVQLDGEMATWDLYLCFAANGKWGATIPEPLFWKRQSTLEVRKRRWLAALDRKEDVKKLLQSKYGQLNYTFPDVSPQFSTAFENIPTSVSFYNPLDLKQTVLLIIPSMANSHANTANLNLVRELSRRGYRVTIICTLLDMYGTSMLSRPYFMQYTHDVFFLPAMLRVTDVPRFLSYMIESRNIELVVISNSRMAYGMLPWLAAKYDSIRFIDYVQSEEQGSKSEGFAMLSTVHEASLDATFISSAKRKHVMLERGHSGFSLHVGYQGIDMKGMNPFSEGKKLVMRKKLGLSPEATVIIYVGDIIDDKKSPTVALEAFQTLVNKERESPPGVSGTDLTRYTLLMVGDGPQFDELEGLGKEEVRLLRALDHDDIINYLGVSDIFCLPSLSDSISFSLAEAMALGVAPLVAQDGGNSELVGKNGVGGILVPLTGDRDRDVNAFANEMRKLALDKDLRKTMCEKAAFHVRTMFDSSRSFPDLVNRILDHPRTRLSDGLTGNDVSPLYYAQENILEEAREVSDFMEIQGAIRGRAREGYGSQYRDKCGENMETVSVLIDLLEDPQPCKSDIKIDVASLQKYAIEQCGQWCIMDLSDKKRISGWRGDERCAGFYTFNDENHECSRWYHKRW